MNSSTGSSSVTSAVWPARVNQRQRRVGGAARRKQAAHRTIPRTVHLGGSR